MVAEPTNESAPSAPRRRSMPCHLMVLVLYLLMTGARVELQDNIMDEEEYKYIDPEEELMVDLETKEKEAAVVEEDWCLEPLKAFFLSRKVKTWIGTTAGYEEVNLYRMGTGFYDLEELYYQNNGSQLVGMRSSTQIWDWNLDLKKSGRTSEDVLVAADELANRQVEDWTLDFLEKITYGSDFMSDLNEVVNSMNGKFNYTSCVASALLWNHVSKDLVEYVIPTVYEELTGERRLWWILVVSCLIGVLIWMILGPMKKRCRCRPHREKGHLSYKRRKWDGSLRKRFECRLRLRGVLFLSCWLGANTMDAGQAAQMMNQMMQMTEAATNAARVSALALEKMDQKKAVGNFGEASKVLRSPESLEGDDPLRYVSWRETFMNWLTYGDPRFTDLIRDVEALDEPCKLSDFATTEVKEMARRLYSILASYVRGPALQLIRAESTEKNGFWCGSNFETCTCLEPGPGRWLLDRRS